MPASAKPLPTRRHLALWFPWLPTERARKVTRPAPPEAEPLALVARSGNALRLAAVDPQAARLGLAPGMALADARARCPALLTLSHEPEADARVLERIAKAMVAFTPLVMAEPPDGVVLDITGCAHLFGGEEALARAAMAAVPHAARMAPADNPVAARALARHGGPGARIADLPVAALELDEDALTGLKRAGLKTVGDLLAHPRASLAARFGQAAMLRLAQLAGEVAAPIVPRRETAPVRAEARFPEPLARTEDMLDVIEDLLATTARDMEARRLGGRRFAVTLCRTDGARRTLAVETGRPVRNPAPVMRLLVERIEGLSDPLDPGFGFDSISLAVKGLEPLSARQVALDRTGEEDADLAQLVDRLAVRFGPDHVRRLVPVDRHLPEKAQGLAPASAPAAAFPPRAADGVQRPLYLYEQPQPVEVMAEVPDGPPLSFRWRRAVHRVRLAEGPERIAAEWWRRKGGHLGGEGSGAGGLTRDYYRVEDTAGRRFWLFRHGLFGEAERPRWYLHGLFP